MENTNIYLNNISIFPHFSLTKLVALTVFPQCIKSTAKKRHQRIVSNLRIKTAATDIREEVHLLGK